MKLIISETDEILVSHSGLGLAGAWLQGTGIRKRSNAIRLGDRKRPEVCHGDVLTAMIALLCLGKPDFGAIEPFRQDEFFRRALGLKKVPSEGTLRQRLDEMGGPLRHHPPGRSRRPWLPAMLPRSRLVIRSGYVGHRS